MNPDTKLFEPETPATPPDWTRWQPGEVFVIKGVPLQIERVTRQRIILRPVGQGEPQPTKKSKPVKRSRGLQRELERKEQRAREKEARAFRRSQGRSNN